MSEPRPGRLLFLTGKLAEPALRRMLDEIAPRVGFTFAVETLPITVVALATTAWIARRLKVPPDVARVIVPGLCQGDLAEIQAVCAAAVERGPRDIADLPDYFRAGAVSRGDYGGYAIEILAEINHAPRLGREELIRQAKRWRAQGADVIDVGCDPGSTWQGVGDAVRELRDSGVRVSIDSFDPREVSDAVGAGAELVLSVNSANAERAADWGVEVVAIPDDIATLGGLDATLERLERDKVRYRIDPVLEPIGMGFAASLGRYLEVRRRYPDAEMLMGVGNLTELTDCDSAGLNTLLLGFCAEVGIRSVLTTEVVEWCRSCVRELAVARKLVHYATTHRVLPKRVETDLVMLRDPRVREHGEAELRDLAARLTDRNFRLFAEGGRLHLMNGRVYVTGDDAFELFEKVRESEEIDPSHAFYLGYELSKAVTALTLGKRYVQDRELRWGMLTVPEASHRAKRGDGGGETS